MIMQKYRAFSLRNKTYCFAVIAVITILNFSTVSHASSTMDSDQFTAAPLSLSQLENLKKENTVIAEEGGLPFDIRVDAIKEAALSYGIRGGLARRTYEIRDELKKRAGYMDKIFNFRQLLISAPSGLMIEPPIISEAISSLLIDDNGQQAAVSDRIFNITKNAKLISAPRTWRTYLEREWTVVDAPPDILRPENNEERDIWIKIINKGWAIGFEQANEVFAEDLNKLTSDFQGMVRYRLLLTQGMVSSPYALQVDRGVTGGDGEMRVGDRAVKITGVPQFITGFDQWQPASR